MYPQIEHFLEGKTTHSLELVGWFLEQFQSIGPIKVEATKTMIGISNDHKRVAWITQIGKQFIHVVFPFDEPYEDNLCFQKVAQVPGSRQFNHHFRMLCKEDVNEEVLFYMKLAHSS